MSTPIDARAKGRRTLVNVLYTAIATASGRDGRAITSDGLLDVKLSLPRELGGSGSGTNPEQLFAAGYAACFASAMREVASGMDLDIRDAAVTAEIGVGPNAEGGYELAATLRVELSDEITDAEGIDLLRRTHAVCPYSNATRGNIVVELVRE